MKFIYITLSAVAGLVTLFITSSLFTEFAPKYQPDGVGQAYVGLLIVGPIFTVILEAILIKQYKIYSQNADKLKKVMKGIAIYTGTLALLFAVIVANA